MFTVTFELQCEGPPEERVKEIHAAFSQLCEHFPEWKALQVVENKTSLIPPEALERAVDAAK